ncbi:MULTISPECIES: hypothetical protein [Pelosinus]|uniref:2 domain-containing protein n=1 Tax=Pelosinus fermentans B4 TaxID=1149862 RepID=I8RKU3_9FIRM|nr:MULTISPECIES: hypothetical protein [Pelosinus]EIW20883.1 2 domain-containing protein [Pelosinus fermentans B4]EIW27250.1 2 domain-containing protein [Pelosinus fermentans A11]
MPTEKLLQEILNEVKSVKNEVFTLREDFSTLKDDISTLKEDVSTLKLNVFDIQSNMVTKDEFMQAIGEQQQDVMTILELTDKKIDRVESEIKYIRRDIRTIEAVTVKNWNEILDLKEAK